MGEFCAHAAMLLAYVKLKDDYMDASLSAALRARLLLTLLSGRFKKMRHFFELNAPGLLEKLENCINAHRAMETDQLKVPTLAEYIQPTADGFSLLFSSLPRALNRIDLEPLFGEVGGLLGAAIIAYDCAADWRRDQEMGDFNIVHDPEAERAALDYAAARLIEMQAICAQQISPVSLSAAIAGSLARKPRFSPEMRPRQTLLGRSISFLRAALTFPLYYVREYARPQKGAVTVFCCIDVCAGLVGKQAERACIEYQSQNPDVCECDCCKPCDDNC
ncbi:MAG: hypothetical protein KDD69_04730 [Bdellovibrionales bacterium]|nr:hypothetical protein [Bdellovibrionales bacterium]